MKKMIFLIIIIYSNQLLAQDTTKKNIITISVFADIYFSYDFNKPDNHLKPLFLYNHNRHNEFNLNLGLLKATYNRDNLRANMGFMAGTYPQYNLASEPELLRHVYEANAGVKISKNNNLWVDVGIMPSHIGYESAISRDNWTLTRSIAAENSPYYETGAKITYTAKNEKFVLSAMVLNGWQRIQRLNANNTPSFGTQLTLKPDNNTHINWSTFIGNDKSDSVKQWRYFNNFYGIFQFNNKLGLTIGFDVGHEQQSSRNKKLNSWYSPSIVFRYLPDDKWAIAARGEYYSDIKGVIITTNTAHGFRTFGGSINFDRIINDNFLWRTEMKNFHSKDPVFQKRNLLTKNNTAFTTSLAVSF